jgi:hypothetical protein
MVVHVVIPATQEVEAEGLESKTGPSKSVRPYLKTQLKQVVWVVEHLAWGPEFNHQYGQKKS